MNEEEIIEDMADEVFGEIGKEDIVFSDLRRAVIKGYKAGKKQALTSEINWLEDDILRLEIIRNNDKTPEYPYDKSEEAQNNLGELPESGMRFLTPIELADNLIKEKKDRITELKGALE